MVSQIWLTWEAAWKHLWPLAKPCKLADGHKEPLREGKMFISLRKYDGCRDAAEVNRRVLDRLMPKLRRYDGFQSYTIVDLGNHSAMSISVFDTKAQAESANMQVRALVREALHDLLPFPPEIMMGEILSETRK